MPEINRIDVCCPICKSPSAVLLGERQDAEDRKEEEWGCNDCGQRYLVTFAVIPIKVEVLE